MPGVIKLLRKYGKKIVIKTSRYSNKERFRKIMNELGEYCRIMNNKFWIHVTPDVDDEKKIVSSREITIFTK